MRRALIVAALVLGAAVRLALLAEKPLWADEIFTLTLARKSVTAILEALRLDSGPPLHYLLARFVLLPFGPAAGSPDILVRVLSLAASLLHVPLLALVARRLGRPEAGLPAAALYALFPIAADFAVEGRAYAVASLFVLAAFERALAIRQHPSPGRTLALASLCGAAVLSHYLAVFPVAALAMILSGAPRKARLALALGGAGGALLFLPWLPSALGQPSASMAWSRADAFATAPISFLVNLAGVSPPERALVLLVPAAVLFLAVAFAKALHDPLRPAALVFVAGLLLLVIAHLLVPSVLLSERPAFLFLPFVALLLADAPLPVPFLSASLSLVALAVSLRGAFLPSPGEALAGLLVPEMTAGRKVCAVALWGPELAYRLERAGFPGEVVLFPSDVARHPGWLAEGEIPEARLASEANALVESPTRPGLFVLPRGSRSAAALAARLAPLGPRLLASGPLADVFVVPAKPSPAGPMDVSPDP